MKLEDYKDKTIQFYLVGQPAKDYIVKVEEVNKDGFKANDQWTYLWTSISRIKIISEDTYGKRELV